MERIIEVKITGSHLSKSSNLAGVEGEGNVTHLRIEFDESWDGYAKTISWLDAKAENHTGRILTVDLLDDLVKSFRVYIAPIPKEALSSPGETMFAIDGYMEGKRQRSVYAKLIVRSGGGFEPIEDIEDATIVEQIQRQLESQVEAIQNDRIAAQAAETNAKTSEENANVSAENAKTSEENANASAENANASAENANASAENANVSAENAKTSEENANASAENAKTSEENANASAENAKTSEENANASAEKSEESAVKSEESAEEAKGHAGNAKEYSEDAEEYAEATKKCMETPPIILDGTWRIWDATLNKYVDTGKKAQGEPGEPGEPGHIIVEGESGDTIIEIDQAYNPKSKHAQSGKAVAEAVVGQKIGTSEIFNDYENNFVSGDYTHSEGHQNVILHQMKLSQEEITYVSYENGVLTVSAENNYFDNVDTKYFYIENTNSKVQVDMVKVLGNTRNADNWSFNIEEPLDILNLSEPNKLKIYAIITQDEDGEYSHVEGWANISNGRAGHVEGWHNKVIDNYGHVEGVHNEAGYGAHVEGSYNKGTGDKCHIEGSDNIATGYGAHIEGSNNKGIGRYVHVEGSNNIAPSDYQHIEGKYNIPDNNGKYIHIAGNGWDTEERERSNAYTLDWKGNGWYQGTVEASAIILRSSTQDSTKKFEITIDDDGILGKKENDKIKYYGDPYIEITDEKLFNFNSNSGTITKYKGPDSIVVIPYKINGCIVKTIGDSAFRDNSYIEKVVIPDSVTSINNYAFYGCKSLTSITIPDVVTSIGYHAFGHCIKLTNIIIPDNITSISGRMVYSCDGLTNIRIPNSVTTIEAYAFAEMDKLISITIPDSVTDIGAHLCEKCVDLKSVTIGNGITNIKDCTFNECRNLTSITIPDSVTNISYTAFSGCPSTAVFYVHQNSYAEDWCKNKKKTYTYISVASAPKQSTTIPATLVIDTVYSIENSDNITLNLPTGEIGNFIQVDFVTTDISPTLTITSATGISDYDLSPEANMIYSLYFDWGILNYNGSKYEYGWRFAYAEYPRIEV